MKNIQIKSKREVKQKMEDKQEMMTNQLRFIDLDRRFTELEIQKEKFIEDLKDHLEKVKELHQQMKNTLNPLIMQTNDYLNQKE